ncbi:MAG: GNAT family N-acetyltransferase [Ruminococcaceae bacterium]|nr:GNAT family N-acetyltransferase [Oscillospiraceae bacterium]
MNLKFTQLTADNTALCSLFEQLMRPYSDELDADTEPLPAGFLSKWVNSIIAMQGPVDRHLELCYDEETLIGFLYGKIDHEDHRGFIKPGYGYIMEFFVLPEHRRKGYGRHMFLRLEQLFAKNGAKRMYLTTGTPSGKAFWEAMGFVNTGTQSPENQLDIYEKALS